MTPYGIVWSLPGDPAPATESPARLVDERRCPKTVSFSLAELPASNITIASLTMSPLRVPDPFPTVCHYSIVHADFNSL
jgi:hypothetical protein